MPQEINISIPEEETTEVSSIPTEVAIEVGRTSEAIDNVEDRLAKVEEGLATIVGLVESLRAIPPPSIDYDAIVERVTAELEDTEEMEDETEKLDVAEIEEVEVIEETEEEPEKPPTMLQRIGNIFY